MASRGRVRRFRFNAFATVAPASVFAALEGLVSGQPLAADWVSVDLLSRANDARDLSTHHRALLE
jgi:hypothetical protein